MASDILTQPSAHRTGHPYLAYEAIQEQPDRIAQVLINQGASIARAAEAATQRQRLMFAGIGSSYHAALVAAFFVRQLAEGRLLPLVEQSFEFVHYPFAVGPEDAAVLISHRGSKNDSVGAIQLLNAAGACTISVTGREENELARAAQFAITTSEQETAFVHTKSYTAALAALAAFNIEVAAGRGLLENPSPARAALKRLPEQIQQTLECESAARRAAREIARRERWIFVGAGPGWPTALESALKAKEMCYFAAEGMETEQFLHGPQVEIDGRACVTVHLTGGAADARGRLLLRACGELGALRVAVTSSHEEDALADHVIKVPAVDEWLTPFVHAVAGQLLAYFVALERGANPDTGREDQPAHARARRLFDP
jgi:glucosamine--fructose-6-phosphate aminotransferase (isomerizing)